MFGVASLIFAEKGILQFIVKITYIQNAQKVMEQRVGLAVMEEKFTCAYNNYLHTTVILQITFSMNYFMCVVFQGMEKLTLLKVLNIPLKKPLPQPGLRTAVCHQTVNPVQRILEIITIFLDIDHILQMR